MNQSTHVQRRQAQWRERVARQEQSGLSVAAFCKDEGISAHTFYWWRARLGKSQSSKPAQQAHDAASFVDLGVLGASAGPAQDIISGFSIRLDLPGGLVLTIARH
jgi:transposase-like protein